VTETDTGDIEDRVRRTGRQHADADPDLASAGHADILPDRGRSVVGY
jgi:hypothetical protein